MVGYVIEKYWDKVKCNMCIKYNMNFIVFGFETIRGIQIRKVLMFYEHF